MMNRRMNSGPRGGNRGNFSQQQPFQGGGGGGSASGNLNPWQGGGQSNAGGILSQLTANPQLALALSSLLQPQQQQPPSLLSLNTSSSSAFSSNDNRDFGNRFNSPSMFSQSRNFRRHEPYNKNRGNFHDRRRSPKRFTDNKRKSEPEKKTPLKKEPEEGTDEEKKRDWKDEKNQADAKDSVDQGDPKETDESGAGDKDGKFRGVPRRYLHCFVCNKQMWDGESMSKHVRGRAHHEMLKAVEESIHICVNILRENLRLQEERKLIEYNRQNRQRKFSPRREPPLSHCAMCDLKFMGKIISHRRTDGHQRLKRYLHPTCRICDKEYPSRIEWIEHCLTPEHMKKASEATENRVGGIDGDEITVEIEDDINMDEALEESIHMEGEDPILELEDGLVNMVDRLPAFKKGRAIAASAIKEFTGFKCELCNRSFTTKEDADTHLTTKRHFYRFIEYIKDKFDKEEKKKKAEREAQHKAKDTEANGDAVSKEEPTDGDAEMYDPSEATEEDSTQNGDEADESSNIVKEESNTSLLAQEEAGVEEEPVPEVPKVTTPSPTVTAGRVRKTTSGPRAKRGRKI